MNQIRSQVARVRRRLILGRFGRACCYTGFAAMLVATIATAVPSIWYVDVDHRTWSIAWVAGSIAAALLTAAVTALWNAPTPAQAAEEIDRRCGLCERVASAMSLSERDRDSDFAAALTHDAQQRASLIDVRDRFSLRPTRLTWLPVSLVPVLALVLLLADPTRQIDAGGAPQPVPEEIRQIQTVVKQLKKSLQQQQRTAAQKGLDDAQDLFAKLQDDLDKVTQSNDLTRKQAMIALNDLKKQLDSRREQLGSPDEIRKAMSQLKGLNGGPAEKVADAIEKGDFGDAQQRVKELADKVRDGRLTDDQRKQLQQQAQQIAKQLGQAAQQHEQQKQDLQQQITQAQKEGRPGEAQKLQEKLGQLRQKDAQMQQIKQMAQAMQQADQAMQNDDAGEAADAMDEMAQQLGDMAKDMAELEDMDAAMSDLMQGKNQMGCQQCQGGGCQSCQGQEGRQTAESDNALDSGEGGGARAEAETETSGYDSQVRGKVKRGRALITGFADGPNRKGVSRDDVQEAIRGTLSEQSDPLENQNLPRAEREHARDYFDRLREGSSP